MLTASYPRRIVCLTPETTEVLYLLGEQDRIVGISGYTVRPAQARKEKPKISAFSTAKIDKILALQPDLVLGFSDLQAEMSAELIKHGIEVHVFNQRSVEEILNMILTLGSLVGVADKALLLLEELRSSLKGIQSKIIDSNRRPIIYFEEWNDPLISGIRWVSELIGIAGGKDCFPDLALNPSAGDRILQDSDEVVRRNPDIIIGSWCGKKFQPQQVKDRAGWSTINAVQNNQLYEIKSFDILSPGPAAITSGVNQIASIIKNWRLCNEKETSNNRDLIVDPVAY